MKQRTALEQLATRRSDQELAPRIQSVGKKIQHPWKIGLILWRWTSASEGWQGAKKCRFGGNQRDTLELEIAHPKCIANPTPCQGANELPWTFPLSSHQPQIIPQAIEESHTMELVLKDGSRSIWSNTHPANRDEVGQVSIDA
jgi:hypothetical protein